MAMTSTDRRADGAGAVTDDPRWARVAGRDSGADGLFWYSVATTGVYCRPSCPSRLANPRNVGFHDSIAAAEAAGFRPCLRCRPNGRPAGAEQAALVARACRLIDEAEEEPRLAALAAGMGLSPSRAHRLFKAVMGITPKAYATARRAARVREELGRTDTVTRAIHQAGFSSSGRFYESAGELLGMTPGRFRAGGAGERLRVAVGRCSLGAILVAATGRGVAAILLGDDPEALARDLRHRFPNAELVAADAAFEATVAAVVAFVEAPGIGLHLPLDLRGTAFQQLVWRALRDIPAGATASYAEIAARIGAPGSVRAVAGACAANPLAVAVPCHRVVRQDGALAGYRWGIERKRSLLAREARR